jgi:uncharacterized protein YaaN involved in tellurite resistance
MIQNQEAIDLMRIVDDFANDILNDINAKNNYLSSTLSSITTASNSNLEIDKKINELKKINNKSKAQKIIDVLKKEQERIKRDNITLNFEIDRVNVILKALNDKYQEGEALKEKIKESKNKPISAEESIFYDENIEGPLDRKMLELKQMITVKMQTLTSIEIVQKNNKVVIQNIDNIKNVLL